MNERKRFVIIDGGDKPKPYRKKGEKQLLICPQCDSTATVEVQLDRRYDGNRVSKGEVTQIRCYHCQKVLVG